LDKSRGDIKYDCNKERAKGLMDILAKDIKELTKEEEWPKVFHILNKNKFPCYYMDKYGINMRWCTLCDKYRIQAARYIRKERDLTDWETVDAIKGNRWMYTNKKS
jgi:hypothetical protein